MKKEILESCFLKKISLIREAKRAVESLVLTYPTYFLLMNLTLLLIIY